MSFGRLWNASAKRFPVFTVSITNGALSATGNVVAQQFYEKDDENPGYQYMETLRFFMYGTCFAPISFRWYGVLSKVFPMKPSTTKFRSYKLGKEGWKTVAKRVAADQFVFAPIAVGTFIISMGVMEGKNLSQIKQNLKDRYIITMLAGYLLWPAAQAVNFSIIPLIYRVPFTGLTSLIWNTFLSFINNTKPGLKYASQIQE
ncbi:Protein SYM1 [Smittium mucronatum]|uniref:Protein SYM1 n=1 Tax=Smittium mucronatum TaxID=133383 RepID=A0A1R0GM96_9FUNG|nr:Protein SYM1 [Smittium mucronatum]